MSKALSLAVCQAEADSLALSEREALEVEASALRRELGAGEVSVHLRALPLGLHLAKVTRISLQKVRQQGCLIAALTVCFVSK